MDELFKTGNLWTAAILGVGAYILWPIARPLAKLAIKGGLVILGTAQQIVTDTTTAVGSVYAEAEAEANGPTAPFTTSTPTPRATRR